MADQLKSCPFCGDDMSSFGGMTPDAFATCDTNGSRSFSVNCDCGTTGPFGPTMAAAVTAWNTRAALDQEQTDD